MMRTTIAGGPLVLLFLLCGCVDVGRALRPLYGENIAVAVDKLGYPSEKRDMLGRTIYRWNTGNPRGMYCNLDLVVDQDNRIERGSWDGNNGGCADLASHLR